MFLRAKTRYKDGTLHRYWSIVENHRVHGKGVGQRQVMYLGEINDAQHHAWCKSIDVLSEDQGTARQMALFPADVPVPALACDVVQVKLNELSVRRPRQWGVMLVGLAAVGSVGAGCVLAVAPAAQSQRHPLAGCAQDTGVLSADRPGQRMAIAPAVVWTKRHGRCVGHRHPGDRR